MHSPKLGLALVSRWLRPASFMIASMCAAKAQCLDWRALPNVGPEVGGDVHTMFVYDDGSGSQLYLGGALVDASGSVTSGVRRWNGTSFSQPGTGLVGFVNVLYACDLGSGTELYAGGHFDIPGVANNQCLAHWNGAVWTPAGPPPRTGSEVLSLCVWNDGTGPALYVGGRLIDPGAADDALGRWDGATWTAVGGGLTNAGGPVGNALVVFDDGSGPALYVGGVFQHAGSLPNGKPNVARWDGTSWSWMANGLAGPVNALCIFDDGSGPAIFAGGNFTIGSSQQYVAHWTGTSWLAVSNWPYVWYVPTNLAVADDGSGPKLFATGAIQYPYYYSTPSHGAVRSWDGHAWTTLDPPPYTTCNYNRVLRTVANYDSGSGSRLYAAGITASVASPADSVGVWTGTSWDRIGAPLGGLALGSVVSTLHVHDDGSGAALYVGSGMPCVSSSAPAEGVVRWTGSTWSPVGHPSLSYAATALATHDPGTGARLFQTADAYVSSWDGSSWTVFGTGGAGVSTLLALHSFDSGSGPELYVGGVFTLMQVYEYGPQTGSPNIVRWNGTHFLPVGSGSSVGVDGAVRAFATFDDASGHALYVGGGFTYAGSAQPLNRIGRWNGTSWSPLGAGVNADIDALAVFDDGSGPALYAAGEFTTAGGASMQHVARWNGSAWSAVGAGLNAQVLTLGVFDDGFGPKLYAGGGFTASGSTPLNHIALWDGTAWRSIGGGVDDAVAALASFDDGSGNGAELFVGGQFQHAGTLATQSLAAWRACTGTISKFCFGDGSAGICPCGNQGFSGRGCDNSFGTGGARLNATGSTNPDSIALYCAGELPSAATLVFQGSNAATEPALFGDGLRCASGSIKRLYTLNASNGSLSVPATGQQSISARSAAQGDVLVPGSVRSYQAWYRDPNTNFCAAPYGSTFNLSNAVRIVW